MHVGIFKKYRSGLVDGIWREAARNRERESKKLRAALTEVQRALELERKQKRRDLMLADRLRELKGRVDALACANFFLRQQLQSVFNTRGPTG